MITVNRSGNKVQDSGSEYGDINDMDMEGEEVLEKIDEIALMVFPIFFSFYNIFYWSQYIIFNTQNEVNIN